MIEMDATRARNESLLPEIRPMDDHQAGKVGRAAEALRLVLHKQADIPLRYQSGSESRGGSDDGGANMTCKSCLFTECSGRAEGVWCVRGVYEPGTDEDEK